MTTEVPKVKTDSCVNLLKVMKSLTHGLQDFGDVCNVMNIFLKFTGDQNLKIVSISYSGLKTLLNHFPF